MSLLLDTGRQTKDFTEFLTSSPGIVFIFAVLFTIAGAILGLQQTAELRRLRRAQIDELDYRQQFENELGHILKDSWRCGESERISVYRHNGHAFTMIGRYSTNPSYKKRSRTIYPDNQGAIGEAWEKRTAVAYIPDFASDEDGYYEAHASWGVDYETAANLSMRSRVYVACSILDAKQLNPVAVAVVESTSPSTLDTDGILQLLRGSEGRRINEFLEKMKPDEPNPDLRDQGL